MNSTFKTWGEAMESLDRAIKAATLACWDWFGKDPVRYAERKVFIVHNTFQQWCDALGIDPVNMRNQMIDENRRGRLIGLIKSDHAEVLCNWIPNEYNVRGVWTPMEKT
jgi:hypothetical protein